MPFFYSGEPDTLPSELPLPRDTDDPPVFPLRCSTCPAGALVQEDVRVCGSAALRIICLNKGYPNV